MTPAIAKAMYARQNVNASTITLRRIHLSPTVPTDVTGVLAHVSGYGPEELVGGIQQGDRKVILPAENIGAFPVPFQTGGTDKIVLNDGRVLNIQIVDDRTARIADELIAYKITARG